MDYTDFASALGQCARGRHRKPLGGHSEGPGAYLTRITGAIPARGGAATLNLCAT